MGSEVSKDFKAAIMNKFKELKETLMAVTEYIVSLNKEVEIVKNKNKNKWDIHLQHGVSRSTHLLSEIINLEKTVKTYRTFTS